MSDKPENQMQFVPKAPCRCTLHWPDKSQEEVTLLGCPTLGTARVQRNDLDPDTGKPEIIVVLIHRLEFRARRRTPPTQINPNPTP